MQKSRFFIVAVLCFLFISADSLQAKPGNSNNAKLNKPLIEKVVVDFNNMEILIFGQYLRDAVEPEISLSSLPIPLPEISLSSLPIPLSVNDTGAVDKVIAILPEWYEDGDHLLVLTTESGTSSYNLDISTPNVQCNNKYLNIDFVSRDQVLK
jgi:hypothetical protein